MVDPVQFVLPVIVTDFLNGKARLEIDRINKVSLRQHKVMDRDLRSDMTRYVGSDAHAAMQRDIDLFGKDAFTGEHSADDPD